MSEAKIQAPMNLGQFLDEGRYTQVVNVSNGPLRFTIAETPTRKRDVDLQPGEVTLIEAKYLWRQETSSGKIIPSVIDRKTCRFNLSGHRYDPQVAEKVVPVDSDKGQAYLRQMEQQRAKVAEKVEPEPEKPEVKGKEPKEKPKATAKAKAKKGGDDADPFEVAPKG